MIEFSNLINHCAETFNNIPFCQECRMAQCHKGCRNDCYNCLAYIHQKSTTNEHYACEKIIYNYVLKHAHRYASEITWAVWHAKEHFNLEEPLRIASVGCGPSTELYGIIRAFNNTPFEYTGFDLSPIWEPLQSYNKTNVTNPTRSVNYVKCDFIQFLENTSTSYDLLILNYFFSDFVKYNPESCAAFIENLVQYIGKGYFSTIIINDIMLLYNNGTGYSCMEKIASLLKDNLDYHFTFQRRHFAHPNQWQFAYGDKHVENLALTLDEEAVKPFEPFEACGSIQLIINTYHNQI